MNGVMDFMKLDEFLPVTSNGTKSTVREDIKAGKVTVNGQVILKPRKEVDPDRDTIKYRDQFVSNTIREYFILK